MCRLGHFHSAKEHDYSFVGQVLRGFACCLVQWLTIPFNLKQVVNFVVLHYPADQCLVGLRFGLVGPSRGGNATFICSAEGSVLFSSRLCVSASL